MSAQPIAGTISDTKSRDDISGTDSAPIAQGFVEDLNQKPAGRTQIMELRSGRTILLCLDSDEIVPVTPATTSMRIEPLKSSKQLRPPKPLRQLRIPTRRGLISTPTSPTDDEEEPKSLGKQIIDEKTGRVAYVHKKSGRLQFINEKNGSVEVRVEFPKRRNWRLLERGNMLKEAKAAATAKRAKSKEESERKSNGTS